MARPKRTAVIDLASKTYLQQVGAPVLPIEDFHPGCVCAIGQMLPGDIDVKQVIKAASIGMRNPQIAALVNVRTDTLLKHFSRTIAAARAQHALELLEMVNTRATDMELGKRHDFQALQLLLDRQDPEPERITTVINVAPLPKEIFEMEPAEMTKQLKHNKENKE